MNNKAGRDEFSNGSWGSMSSSFFRMVGGFGNISGPGMFMVRSVTAGFLTSILVGTTCGYISAIFYGTAGLPFIISASAGYILGLFGFYRDTVRRSLLFLDRYPALLQLHLDGNFPHEGFDRWSREALRSSNFTSWRLRSMLAVAWLSAVPAIENIAEAKEQKLIDSGSQELPSLDGASRD